MKLFRRSVGWKRNGVAPRTPWLGLVSFAGLLACGSTRSGFFRTDSRAADASTPFEDASVPDGGSPAPGTAARAFAGDEWIARIPTGPNDTRCPSASACDVPEPITRTSSVIFCRYRCRDEPIFEEANVVVNRSRPVVVPLQQPEPMSCSEPVGEVPDLSDSIFDALKERTLQRLTLRDPDIPNVAEAVTVIALDTTEGWDTRANNAESQCDRSPHARQVVLAARLAACGQAPDGGPLNGAGCSVNVDSRAALSIFGASLVDPEHPILCRDGDARAECRHFDEVLLDLPMHCARLHGGYYGTKADLAQQLEAVVAQMKAKTLGPRVVINLSVGWHAKHDCVCYEGEVGCSLTARDGCPSRLDDATPSIVHMPDADQAVVVGSPVLADVESQSVFSSIARARCLGALVVAAAGNAIDEDRSGPLLPAGWESFAFNPDDDTTPIDCDQLFHSTELNELRALRPERVSPDLIRGRLVYTVAGVNSNNTPLFNVRDGAVPRLVAHGESVAIQDSEVATYGIFVKEPHVALTGSSMAAAVFSGSVAARWARGRELTGAQAVEALYEEAAGGPELPFATSLCPSLPVEGKSGEFVRAPCEERPRLISGCTAADPKRSAECARTPVAANIAPPLESLRATACLLNADEATICTSACADDDADAGISPQSDAGATETPACYSIDCGDTPLVAFSELDMPWAFPQPNPPVECATCSAVFDDDYIYVNRQFSWDIGTASLAARLKRERDSAIIVHKYNVSNLVEGRRVRGFVKDPEGYILSTDQASRLTVTVPTPLGRAVADLSFVYYDLH